MPVGRIVDIAIGIVIVAGVTVAVSSPNTSNIILSFGRSFAGALQAAMGQYS